MLVACSHISGQRQVRKMSTFEHSDEFGFLDINWTGFAFQQGPCGLTLTYSVSVRWSPKQSPYVNIVIKRMNNYTELYPQ